MPALAARRNALDRFFPYAIIYKYRHIALLYLVTGFLTAVNITWTIEPATNTANSLDANAPLSTLINVPVPGMLDFGFQPRVFSGAQQSRELSSEGEGIFAVSYSVVKLKH